MPARVQGDFPGPSPNLLTFAAIDFRNIIRIAVFRGTFQPDLAGSTSGWKGVRDTVCIYAAKV
jgi:hypothetical protein